MKVYNPIDFICLLTLCISKIFKKKKRFEKIYEKIAVLIELRYLQTSTTKTDDKDEENKK